MSQASSVNLTWQLSPIQRRFFESGARYRTLVGGRRFGKNVAALASQADFALNPGEYGCGRDDPSDVVTWWVGPTYTQSKKYGFQTALEMIPDALIDGEPKRTTPFEIPLYNGVTMEFYSYDRHKSLDGAGVDDIVIDERGYMDTTIWNENLAAMLLDTDGRVAYIGKPAVAVVAEHPRKPEAYVLDVARARGQTPAQASHWLANAVSDIPTNQCYIEAVQAQEWFLQDAKDAGLSPVPVDHDRPKEERLMFLSVPFSNGNVKLVEGTDWGDFEREWQSFPDGDHDDQLDALEMALRNVSFVDHTTIMSADPYSDDE